MTDDIYFEADDTEEGIYEAALTAITKKVSQKDGETFLVWEFKTPEGKTLSGSSSTRSRSARNSSSGGPSAAC